MGKSGSHAHSVQITSIIRTSELEKIVGNGGYGNQSTFSSGFSMKMKFKQT
jgi:hypothetical protein